MGEGVRSAVTHTGSEQGLPLQRIILLAFSKWATITRANTGLISTVAVLSVGARGDRSLRHGAKFAYDTTSCVRSVSKTADKPAQNMFWTSGTSHLEENHGIQKTLMMRLFRHLLCACLRLHYRKALWLHTLGSSTSTGPLTKKVDGAWDASTS